MTTKYKYTKTRIHPKPNYKNGCSGRIRSALQVPSQLNAATRICEAAL